MAVVRCPRCGKAFERTAHQLQVCPNCGLRAPIAAPEERIVPEGLVGRPRRAWVVFLLSWLAWVAFWPFYLLRVFRQLDKQHGRDHPIVVWSLTVVPHALSLVLVVLALIQQVPWWVTPFPTLLTVFFALPYAWMELWRLQRSRRARALAKGVGPFWFLLVAIVTPLAAIGYALVVHATGGPALFPDFGAFDLDTLLDFGSYEATFWTENPDWVLLWVLLFGVSYLSPAIALAVAAASANKLWRAIYDEKGEAWPYRTETAPEPDIPMSP